MRFGIATVDITPPFPTAMHGYGGRDGVFTGVHDRLQATVLILEESARRALIAAVDLCTMPNNGSVPALLARLAAAGGCAVDQVMVNASHTHGGPRLPGNGILFQQPEHFASTARYTEFLYDQLVHATQQAVHNLQPGTLWLGAGTTTVPMNRRLDRAGAIVNAPNPAGPFDNQLLVWALRDARAKLAAVGIRVSCHPVATGRQTLITADFPGAWRAAAAQHFGSDVSLFFLQGAGGDARPRAVSTGEGWRDMPHAQLAAIGQQLLTETQDVFRRDAFRPVRDLTLTGTTRTIAVPCEKRFVSADAFASFTPRDEWDRQFIADGLQRLARGQALTDHAAYQLQTLWLNSEVALIGIDAEPLCGLGARMSQAVAPALGIVLGYVNGCVSYLPDTPELARGGYESDSYIYERWSGPWLPGIETAVLAGIAPPPSRGAGFQPVSHACRMGEAPSPNAPNQTP